MKVLLGITRARLVRGSYQTSQHPDDFIEIDIEDDEYLDAVWMTSDGQKILHLPLGVVPRM